MAFWDDADIVAQDTATTTTAGATIGFVFGGPPGAAAGAKIGAALGAIIGLGSAQRRREAERAAERLEAERKRRAFEAQVSQYRGAIEARTDTVKDFIKNAESERKNYLGTKTEALTGIQRAAPAPSGIQDLSAQAAQKTTRDTILSTLERQSATLEAQIDDYGKLEKELGDAKRQKQNIAGGIDTSGLDAAKELAERLGRKYG